MSRVDSLARAVLARIASKRRPRKPPAGLAGTLASAVARRLNAPAKRKPRSSKLASAVASAVALRLGKPGGAVGAAGVKARVASVSAPKTLAGTRIAARVARQVASQIPETRADFGSDFAAIDVAKVAAAVIAKLDASKGKGVDHVDVLASQIASRLSVPRIQGSAAGAADFQSRIVTAVVDAVKQQRAKAFDAATVTAAAAEAKPAAAPAAGEKSAPAGKQS